MIVIMIVSHNTYYVNSLMLKTNKLRGFNDGGIIISISGRIHPIQGGVGVLGGGSSSQNLLNKGVFIPSKIKKIIIIIWRNILNLGWGSF